MLFSSIPFIYFYLPIIILIYFIAPAKLKNMVLLLGSLFFYAWGEQNRVLLLMGTILFGWCTGILIESSRTKKLSRVFLVITVVAELGLLGYFKYTDFFISNWNRLFRTDFSLLHIALPIGISFYTFQMLSYSVDVYRREVKAQKNPVVFATYVSLFPQLIAGPIVRYADVQNQMDRREHRIDKIAYGVKRFLIGMGKKVLIANACGQLCALFRATAKPSILYCWLNAVGFTLQIYYDFSGYSDMAIGLGNVFGFQFPENFDYPYISRSITEFWRRWHISLSSWFRDYVYIPLGGNRKGGRRQLCNIMLVWMLTGFWHGASWNFVFWGLFYALLLMLEKLFLLNWLNKHRILGHIYTMTAVVMGFVLFQADGLWQAGQDFAGMLGISGLPFVSAEAVYYLKSYALLLVAAMIGTTPVVKDLARRCVGIFGFLQPVFLTAVLLLVTAYLLDGTFNPFLYFRF